MQNETERFINRDTSWLAFNERVLGEAMDEGNELLERLKFISIVSSNLDEFFMVRMAGLDQQRGKPQLIPYRNYSFVPEVLYAELDATIRRMTAKQSRYLSTRLFPALAGAGIHVQSYGELSLSHQDEARLLFEREILPVITPIAVDPSHPFPVVPNLALELLVRLVRTGPQGKTEERFAVLEAPAVVRRFLELQRDGDARYFVPLEDVIAHNLEQVFRGCKVLECSSFRVTRDMDFSIDEESIADLLSEMQIALQKKTKRRVVRLEISSTMSRKSRTWLMKKLAVPAEKVYSVSGLLNLKPLFELALLRGYPHLTASDMPPLPVPECATDKSMFEIIRSNGEFLIHLPYESFDPVVRFLEEAAADPSVLAIKQTLYRVGTESPIVDALVKAARNGKQVSVLFEIKARFDEANNIRYAQELSDAGAHVVYGIAGLKVHCKALLVVRKEPGGIRRYVHLATGNYNAKTACLYTDLGFFSADPALTRDVASLFNVITGFSDPPTWNQLLAAPFNLKDSVLYMIDREARLSSRENPGLIRIKANAIVDYEVIEHLYAAAERNVRIELIVRGICGVNPYVLKPAARKNIFIISIVDRFLEHSRIYYFRNNGQEEYYIGSADLMPRNLRRRIELLCPIPSSALREELDFILLAALDDRRKGRRMIGPNRYSPVDTSASAEPTRSQYRLYEHYRVRNEKQKDARSGKRRKLVIHEKRD